MFLVICALHRKVGGQGRTEQRPRSRKGVSLEDFSKSSKREILYLVSKQIEVKQPRRRVLIINALIFIVK